MSDLPPGRDPLQSQQNNDHLEHKEHYHAHSRDIQCSAHVVKGLLMGFFGFVIPVSLQRRRIFGIRKGLAIALLLGTFRMLDCSIWRLRAFLTRSGKYPLLLEILSKYATGIAGGLSIIPPILVDKPSILNSTMILWICIRALRSLVPSIKGGAVVIMCLSASQILTTWIRTPWDLSPSYRKFLNVQGGKPQELLQHLWEGRPLAATTCLTHPGLPHWKNFIIFFIQGLRRALPLYIPLHLFAFYFSRRKDVKIALVNLFRSVAFLSLYCTFAWTSGCLGFHLFKLKGVTRLNLMLITWFAGLATVLEREGRQKELAAYCLTHAFDSFWGYLKRTRNAKPNDLVGALMVISGFGTIMQYHHHQPDFITRMLFGIGMKTRQG